MEAQSEAADRWEAEGEVAPGIPGTWDMPAIDKEEGKGGAIVRAAQEVELCIFHPACYVTPGSGWV